MTGEDRSDADPDARASGEASDSLDGPNSGSDALDGPFLADAMCGSLATILRMCGFDTAYALDRGVESDDALRAIAHREDRTMLTRDRVLADAVDRAVGLESTDTDAQLRALADRGLALELPDRPERCSACNGSLDPVQSGPTPADVPNLDERPVWRCPDCEKHFWRGSHWDAVADRLAAIRGGADGADHERDPDRNA
ncbi:MAG: Mut7-C RNAse domain-containing protein [Halococcoides sp.]